MSWNIAPEIISMVFLGIIWEYSRKGSRLPTLRNKAFQTCLMVTFGAMLSNVLSTVLIYKHTMVPSWITWGITMIYFILTPLMGMVYFFYTLTVAYGEDTGRTWTFRIGIIPGILYTLLVLLNPFTHALFYITPEEGYIRGNLIVWTYIIFYTYCLSCMIMALISHKKVDKKVYHILMAFPIMAVVVVVIQQIYPDIILSGSAATCAMLLIYLNFQNKQISLDHLTGLQNRQELLDMLDLKLKRSPEKAFVLVVVSLRDFRQVNNAGGQQTGDFFLKDFSKFLCSIEQEKSIYRFNGDEFALFFTDFQERITACIKKIEQRMLQPWKVGDYNFALSAVLGIVCHRDPEENLGHVINSIEYAIFQAKTGMYGTICYCDETMMKQLERKEAVMRILKEKVQSESFEMYYQPIYSVKEEAFLYAESLMRIPDSPIGPIYPSEFIPIAEETGLIIDLTYIALKKVCQCVNRVKAAGTEIHSVHVNFSAIQFSQADLVERVIQIIQENGTSLSAIKIEFTESTLAENPQTVTEFAFEMKRRGLDLGLDDFGTGYSNIATVIHIPFRVMKLDRSLIEASMKNTSSALVIRDVVHMFHNLDTLVVAEGVENEAQRDMVIGFGVDQIQGFFYARPMPEHEFIAMLKQDKS